MCQVYKGEIEEKNQAASSNSTAGIIRRFLSAVNYFLKIYPTDSNFAKKLARWLSGNKFLQKPVNPLIQKNHMLSLK
ncbi:hypothetical protein NEILACOT_04279 [Neisseria lactamica ATCC 23970]|uniref:Uncharacterized protein n=1 Tax=Neisseria lactamica ATCC 23970 TaxID=546265 RepID=D0W9R5_NEILA|nr:hypothetical protein [Neisseria lactamica]EEZ75724.1 hypothetical protein NEILACOT_04279 [Neisseria lactamica ATCC 23970]